MESDTFVIDIGKWIEGLLRQWQWIVSALLLCSILGGTFALLLPPRYVAQVLVASTKSESSVSFGSSIKTLSEAQLTTGTSYNSAVDRKERQQSYLQMVKNPEIARVVLADVQDRLGPEERTVDDLLDMVDGDIATNSDSIRITVVYRQPDVAAEIANAWGREYVQRVNAVYSGVSSNTSYQTVKDQAVESKNTYDQAQAAVVDFTAHSKISELNRRIGDQEAIINSLSSVRNSTVSKLFGELIAGQQDVVQQYFKSQSDNQLLALQRDQESRRQLITAYTTALQSMRQKVFDEQVNDKTARLTQLYADKRRIEVLLANADDMRNQVQRGGAGAAASNALAISLLKAQVFATVSNENNIQVQAVPATIKPDDMIKDLQGLSTTLKQRLITLDKEIQAKSKELQESQGLKYLDQGLELSGELAKTIAKRYPELFQTGQLADLSLQAIEKDTPLSKEAKSRAKLLLEMNGMEGLADINYADTPIEKKILELEQEVRDLKAQVTQENDRLQELTRARDLAWETYKNLAVKEAELAVSLQTKGTEVSLATTAYPPKLPSTGRLKWIVTSAAVGLLLGLTVTFCAEFWWNYKGIQPRPLVSINFNRLKPKKKK